MERRVLRKEGKGYMELPPELAQREMVELFALRDGYYLLVPPLSTKPEPEGRVKTAGISEAERGLLRKLSGIKFQLRTLPQVEKMLDREERAVLQQLVQNEYVNIFKSRKYPQGVYNINDKIYPWIGSEKTAALPRPAAVPAAPPKAGAAASPSAGSVLSEGYAVFEDARAAMQISDQLRKAGKVNSVRGIKGFDGKFYMVGKSYFGKAMPLILNALEEPKNVEDLAKATKLPAAACLAMLRLLGEDGEVVEKKKGVFAKA